MSLRRYMQIVEDASEPGLDGFFDALPAMAERHPGVAAQIEDNDGAAYIASLEAKVQGRGFGSAFMTDLCGLADQHGVLLETDPSESELDRLGEFYQRFGFDWVDGERMAREPR